MNYTDVKQTAKRWGVHERRVTTLCRNKRIIGAKKDGKEWLIPDDAQLPADLSEITVNKSSSSQQKINLFKTLFVGRTDVFARRWYSMTTEKSGYQLVCANEWVEGLCDKKKYKCNICPNRKLMPLSDKDIYNHLAGKDKYCSDVFVLQK